MGMMEEVFEECPFIQHKERGAGGERGGGGRNRRGSLDSNEARTLPCPALPDGLVSMACWQPGCLPVHVPAWLAA